MAILQLTAVQRQANIVNDINNVFHYESSGDPTSNDDVEELAQQWIDEVQPSLTLVQSDQIVYLEIRVVEVNGLYFSTITQGAVDGEVTGNAMPPYVAFEFIYNRATRATRNGFKRFAGVVEEQVDQAGNVSAGWLTNLNTLAVALNTPLVLTWATCTPIIYGRPTPPPTSLPERINGIQSVGFQRITTQNSRKPWL